MAKNAVNGTTYENKAPAGRKYMSRGIQYLVVSGLVLFALLYLLPNALRIDIAGIMKSQAIVSALRIALGIGLLAILAMSLIYVARSFTLSGQTWREGLSNACRAHIFGRDAISILLLCASGVALVAWGVIGLIGA